MEQGICRLPRNELGLIIALDNPTSHRKLKIQQGNGPTHANEIEYVSQYNCENWAILDWSLCRKEVLAESWFINVLLSIPICALYWLGTVLMNCLGHYEWTPTHLFERSI